MKMGKNEFYEQLRTIITSTLNAIGNWRPDHQSRATQHQRETMDVVVEMVVNLMNT